MDIFHYLWYEYNVNLYPHKRRNFFRSIALGGVGAALTPVAKAASSLASEKMKPKTNVKQALAIPRNEYSMPGKYPGKVAR